MNWAKFFQLLSFFLCFCGTFSASAKSICADVHTRKSSITSNKSIFESAKMTELPADELKVHHRLSAIWAEMARGKVRELWSDHQIEELRSILRTDTETSIDLYLKALKLKESYELPEYAFIVSMRLEEAINKLNIKIFEFEGEKTELKFKYHSVNRYIFERLILETHRIDFSAEQLAVLIKAERLFRDAEAKQLAGDSAAVAEVKNQIMRMVSRYFPPEVLPDLKTVLRVILVKGVSAKGCCGFGCSTCTTYKVRGALELFGRVVENSSLPFVNALREE